MNPGRRALLGALALPASSHDVSQTTTTCDAPHPDAELLALCARLRGMEDEWNRLYALTSDAKGLETEADRAWQDYTDRVWPCMDTGDRAWLHERVDPTDLPRRLVELRATTLDGMRAKAAAILAMEDAGCWTDCRNDAYDFMRSIVRDVAGDFWHPMADGTEPHA